MNTVDRLISDELKLAVRTRPISDSLSDDIIVFWLKMALRRSPVFVLIRSIEGSSDIGKYEICDQDIETVREFVRRKLKNWHELIPRSI